MFPSVWLLFACGPGVSLGDVPIEGGTAAQRVDVRTQLIDFDQAVGADRVRLRKVRLLPLEGYVGSYDHVLKRVDLVDTLDSYASLVDHELCHALVSQDELLDDVPAVVAELEAGLFASSRSPPVEEAEDQLTETVASFCETGPVGAQVSAILGDGPPLFDPDPDLRRRTGAWLLDRVWSAHEGMPPLLLAEEDIVWSAAASTAIAPTDDPRVVIDPSGNPYDLYTGEPVISAATATASTVWVPEGLSGTLFNPYAPARAGVPGGTASMLGTWDLYHLGVMTAWLATDGEHWRLVGDGFFTAEQTLFTADGQVWTAFREDGLVGWRSISAAWDASP